MGEKGFLTTEMKVFIDGKELTNFFPAEVQFIEPDSEESMHFLKGRFDFSGTITLSRKASKRLRRIIRKHLFRAWVQGWFRVGSR